MSYNNPYNGNGGYGQQNPYSQGISSNNGHNNNYSTGGYGQNVEMEQYNGGMATNNYSQPPMNPGYTTYNSSEPANLLNTCQALDRGIDDLERRLQSLQQLHRRVINDQAQPSQVDRENSEIMAGYRGLGDRLKKLKTNPASGSPMNAPQVGRVDRKLKKAIQDYQQIESQFRRQIQESQARQYRIVRPDASEEEVRAAVEDPNTQIFQQALMNSNRQGQAQSTLSAVRARHAEIQRIAETMAELAQLFHDLDNIVMEQDALVTNIETKGEEVQQNIYQANEQLDTGIKKARSARKKKWCCFWLVIIIIIIIVVVVVAYVLTHQPPKANTKRAVEYLGDEMFVRRALGLLME